MRPKSSPQRTVAIWFAVVFGMAVVAALAVASTRLAPSDAFANGQSAGAAARPYVLGAILLLTIVLVAMLAKRSLLHRRLEREKRNPVDS